LRFEDGLALAASEENKSLRVLSVLLDSITDPEKAASIQRIINKKIINRNLLSFIKSNSNYPFKV
jgi:rubrerythrin